MVELDKMTTLTRFDIQNYKVKVLGQKLKYVIV